MEEKDFWKRHPKLDGFTKRHPFVIFVAYAGSIALAAFLYAKALEIAGCSSSVPRRFDPETGDTLDSY